MSFVAEQPNGTHHQVVIYRAFEMDTLHLEGVAQHWESPNAGGRQGRLGFGKCHLQFIAKGYGIEYGLQVVVTVGATFGDVEP